MNNYKVIFPLPSPLRDQYGLNCIRDRYFGFASEVDDCDQPDFVHTLKHLCPKSQYPELWVSGQVDIRKPEVLPIVLSNLERRMIKFPQFHYWSVSQEDNNESLINSTDLINFVNKVAEYFPDKIISTLAYYSTEEPPTVVPRENVEVMITTIQIPKDKPYQTATRNDVVDWRNRLKRWMELTPNILVWDYYSNFRHLLMPYPVLMNIVPNLRWFEAIGVKSFIIQTNYGVGHEFADVKAELIATKGNLNPILIKRYGICLFPYIRRYIDLLAKYQKLGKWLICYADPSEFRQSFLSDKALAEYTTLLNRKGLEEIYLQVLYAMIELGKGTEKIRRQFSDTCGQLGNVTVNENNLLWSDYLKTKTF